MAGVLVAGVCVDGLLVFLRPGPRRLVQLRIFAAAAPLVTWSLYIATAQLTSPPIFNPDGTVQAIPELYTGAPVVQALLGLAVGVMLLPGSNRSSVTASE
jgi:hypothetical protein